MVYFPLTGPSHAEMPRLALQRCRDAFSSAAVSQKKRAESVRIWVKGIDILRISEDFWGFDEWFYGHHFWCHAMADSMVLFIGPNGFEHKIFHRDFLRFHCSDFYWKPWYACIIGVNEVNLRDIHYEFLSRWGPNRSYVGRPSKKRELQTSRQNLIEFIATNDSSPRAKLGQKNLDFVFTWKVF